MTAETDPLPLPKRLYVLLDYEARARVRAYARANLAHATAARDAEVEALRERLRVQDEAAEREIRHQHGRAERLAEALRYAVEQVPELATVPGIAALLHPDPLLTTAARNLRQYLAKASFSSSVDRRAATNCLDVLEAAAIPQRAGDAPMRSDP